MSEGSNIHEGGCLCGGIRYRARGPALWVAHCHCRSCRRSTGAAMTSFVGFQKARYEITAGTPRVIESSPGVWRRFCPDCGSQLTYEANWCADETHVYLATLDRPEAFRPERHVFTEAAMPWLRVADDLPRHEGTSSGAAAGGRVVREREPGITGGCLCGAVRYRLSEPLAQLHYCHCRLCQQAFASPFGVWGSVPTAALGFTRGSPKSFSSSAFAERGFCPDCGSQVSFRYLDSGRISLATGSLDAPETAQPERHWGIESRLSWLCFDDGLPAGRTEDDPDYRRRHQKARS